MVSVYSLVKNSDLSTKVIFGSVKYFIFFLTILSKVCTSGKTRWLVDLTYLSISILFLLKKVWTYSEDTFSPSSLLTIVAILFEVIGSVCWSKIFLITPSLLFLFTTSTISPGCLVNFLTFVFLSSINLWK